MAICFTVYRCLLFLKNKVDQNFHLHIRISSLLVFILGYCNYVPISMNDQLYLGAKMVIFVVNIKEIEK